MSTAESAETGMETETTEEQRIQGGEGGTDGVTDDYARGYQDAYEDWGSKEAHRRLADRREPDEWRVQEERGYREAWWATVGEYARKDEAEKSLKARMTLYRRHGKRDVPRHRIVPVYIGCPPGSAVDHPSTDTED